jgi:NTP pyrophosphatase (non-canonical NTP hydrolase)
MTGQAGSTGLETAAGRCWTLARLQKVVAELYGDKDRRRGIEGTFMWLMAEVGELSAVLRGGSQPTVAAEFADVLAWLASIANVAGIDLEAAIEAKYGSGCPGCKESPCTCPDAVKP